MAIQLKSGLILLNGGQIANDPSCCCGIDPGVCTCNGVNSITVAATDNFGYSPSYSGNYASAFVPATGGCAWTARSPSYDSGIGYGWRVIAPVILSGGLSRIQLDWFSPNGPGVIRIPYPFLGTGPFRLQRAPGLYIDFELLCL